MELHDLFAQAVELKLPAEHLFEGRLSGNPINHLRRGAGRLKTRILAFEDRGLKGFKASLPDRRTVSIVSAKTSAKFKTDAVLLLEGAVTVEAIVEGLEKGQGKWLFPRPENLSAITQPDLEQRAKQIVLSWRDRFVLRKERTNDDGSITPGLRSPQVGAVQAALAHWSVSDKPVTVVMPTGTGKTETMLALMVAAEIPRVLVVVPNAQLRTQISDKFLELGVLKACGCLDDAAQLPITAVLRHIPKTIAEVDEIFLRANVIVTTMQVAGNARPEIQERMAHHVTNLFVDEAHHIAAKTWTAFKAQFAKRRVLQFTATPYRNDGRRVDGKFIYVYPLRKAQEERYFKKIRFEPIQGDDQDETDTLIIAKVRDTLNADTKNGFKHLVMARVDTIPRAKELHARYAKSMPKARPILMHSKLGAPERLAGLEKLRSGASLIVVCVNMLGEGFDLPELKIAALHDKHKSESVTLQFIGRFTRARSDLGDATVIANIAHDDVSDTLRGLYAEDADWNHLLNVIGEKRTESEERREAVFDGFSEEFEGFPMATLFPRMSTVVYQTACDIWRPQAVIEAMSRSSSIVEGPIVNDEERLVIFVTRHEEKLRWSNVKEPQDIEYNLYLAHWDEEHKLLYVNSSRMSDLHLDVAKAIAGETVIRLSGDRIFRVLDGYRRLVLTNLGLSETQRRPVRYSMFIGSDIAEQLDALPGNRNRTKTNLFGQGYTEAGKSTIGCSVKGKIWSYEATNNFGEWIDWCNEIGRKLLDETITTDGILRNLVRPRKQTTRPPKAPIAIAWPEGLLVQPEERIEIEVENRWLGFYDCDIDLSAYTTEGPILFKVTSEETSADFQMEIDGNGARYSQISGPTVQIRTGKKTKTLLEYFREDPPHIYFADGDMLLDNDLFVLPRDGERPAFDLNRIQVLRWEGVDITKESQRDEKRADSIQRHVIERLVAEGDVYDVIFDDDGTGESADVVAMRLSGSKLTVHLHHCKFSADSKAGARLDDLYEVCGQTQKSIRWRERPDIFLRHLLKREADRKRAGRPSRFEKGTGAIVNGWLNRWKEFHYEFSATIVQPGFSKSKASQSHLELFAATESLLMDTWGMRLEILASK
jgi:superfamily II DNA or RNA helicase